MARVEERVAHLDGQVNELSQGLSDIRATIRHFEQGVDVRFDVVDRRLEALDSKVSRQFVWLVGIIVTALVTVVGAVLSRG
jgi:hypothetical protein